jgi:predicted PurR-regulated permease PerM
VPAPPPDRSYPGERRPLPPADQLSGARRLGELRPEHLYKGVLLFFMLALVFRYFTEIAETLLLIYAAAIVAVALHPLAKRLPLQRRIVAGLTGAVVLALVGVGLWLGVPALVDQLRQFGERVPDFAAQLEGWAERLREATGLNIAVLGGQTADTIRNLFQTVGTQELFGRARGVLEFLLLPFVVLIGGLYALADPNHRLLSPLMRAVPKPYLPSARRITKLLGIRLFGWIRGTLLAMLCVGVLTSAALYLIGVPYWLLLGLFVGLVEFVPILGPWIGGIPAVAIAFLDDPTKGLWTAAAILVIQQLESWLITPWAMSQAAQVHPLVTLFALILFGSIFGFLGVVLALPIVILIWTLVQVLWVERALDNADTPLPPVVEE